VGEITSSKLLLMNVACIIFAFTQEADNIGLQVALYWQGIARDYCKKNGINVPRDSGISGRAKPQKLLCMIWTSASVMHHSTVK